jgi:hypothetical protein
MSGARPLLFQEQNFRSETIKRALHLSVADFDIVKFIGKRRVPRIGSRHPTFELLPLRTDLCLKSGVLCFKMRQLIGNLAILRRVFEDAAEDAKDGIEIVDLRTSGF